MACTESSPTPSGPDALLAERIAAGLDITLLRAVSDAEDALARIDERLAKSALSDGFCARTHFYDASAALWLAGELVPLEDLVLHDAGMDLRAPTHELTRAAATLRARRRIAASPPGRFLTRPEALRDDKTPPSAQEEDVETPPLPPCAADLLAAELAALDAAIERSAQILRAPTPDDDPGRALLYDADLDAGAGLSRWRREVEATESLPATLAAAIALDAWSAIDPLPRQDWLGPLLVADLLRRRGKARAHLPALHVGLRAIPRERRRSRSAGDRIAAALEAIVAGARLGLDEHDRLALAKATLDRRCQNLRRNARLPALAELALSTPLLTAPMIAAALGVTARAAQDMAPALGLRELTGRSRFRAWGV